MADTLWFDADQRSTFLVPDDASLPEGDLWLKTFDGRVRGFDAGAIEPHRVGEAEARKHVRAWVEAGWDRARAAFTRGYGDESPVPPSLEAAIGVDPARFAQEPEAFVEAARHVGGRLKRWLDDEAPPETAAPIRTAAAALAELLGAVARGAAEEE